MNKILCYFGFHKYKMQDSCAFKHLIKGTSLQSNQFRYYRYVACVRCGQMHKKAYLYE
jgi:hypothetical protein